MRTSDNTMVQPELWGFFGETANAWEDSRDWCAQYLKENSGRPLAMVVGFLKVKGFEHSAIQAALILYVES